MAAVKPQHYGSSRSGLAEWLLQRVTAIYSAGFALYFILRTWWRPFPDQVSWVAWLDLPMVKLGLITFWLATLVHAWIGVRSVAMDYIHTMGVRLTLLIVTGLLLVLLALWGILLLVGGAQRGHWRDVVSTAWSSAPVAEDCVPLCNWPSPICTWLWYPRYSPPARILWPRRAA